MVRVNAAEYLATKEKVAKINARAAKRGFTGSFELAAERVEITETDLFGFEKTTIWYDVTLTGTAPSYGGWSFIAAIDWAGETPVVRTSPGIEGVDRESLRQSWCEHCKTNRYRNNTYLVRNDETGQQVQVGSTCIKDFLGWDAGVVFLDTESAMDGLSDSMGFPGGGLPDTFSTLYVLAVAWAIIKLDGFRPASHANSTKSVAFDVLDPPRVMSQERRAELARLRALAEEAKVRAAECLAWLRSDDFSGTSEYVQNMKAIAGQDEAQLNHVGFLVSAPQAWARWQERTLIRQAQKSSSSWAGKVGERITFTAMVEAVRFIPGDFGTTTLYVLRDAAGNVYKWFSSRGVLGDETGREVTLKATIKALDTYNDVKQTVITRAKEQA